MLRTRCRHIGVWVVLAAIAGAPLASAQMMPGGRLGAPGDSMGPTPDDETPHPADPKPEAAAKKALAAGLKSLDRAKELEAAAATAPNDDKRAKLLEKLGDTYYKALDQFTDALSNNSELIDAWNGVGYVHLKLRAYREAVDDYNHALALKPDMLPSEEQRAEAYLAIDHLDEVEAAYMDLFYHAPPLAAQLMSAMQQWLKAHRADAAGMRAKDIDAFDKWLAERDSIAKQTASLPQGGSSTP